MAGAARQRGETLWQSTQLPSLVEQQQGQTPPRVSRGSCAYAERACYSCRMGAALGAPLGESPGHWVRPEPGLPSVRALEPQGRRIQYATVDYMQHALTGRVLLLWLPSTCLHPARLPRPCGGPCDMLTAPSILGLLVQPLSPAVWVARLPGYGAAASLCTQRGRSKPAGCLVFPP